MADQLFAINPGKFKEAAKGRTYEEFCEYFMGLSNFQIFRSLTESDKRRLYELSK